jgi:protoporphyrinogen oxidase
MPSCKETEGLVILGGGVSGLMAALESGAQVYEAEQFPGGAASSDASAGFVFDQGIHVLQTHNMALVKTLEDLGVKFRIVDRSAHTYTFGKYTAYPFQINSTSLRLDRRLRCVAAFLRRGSNPEPANYADWIYRSVGRGFGDTFLIPYSEKFWGVHPRDMTFEWTGNRVPKAETWQVLRGAILSRNTRVGTNATFRYPVGPDGYGTVANCLARAVGSKLHTGQRATRVDIAAHKVTFESGKTVDYRLLLSTIPLPTLAEIVTEMPAPVRAAIASLRTNSIMVVNIGIDRADLTDKHWIHFPEKDISFFRISFPHNFASELVPPGKSSISAEVSYPPGSPPEPKALTQRVIEDLRRVGILRGNDVTVMSHTRDIPWGYCIFDETRLKALPIIMDWLATVDIVPAGRYGLWTYFWSDEAMMSGREAAGAAMEKLLGKAALKGGVLRPGALLSPGI